MSGKSLTMMAAGDLILSMPEPESYFKFVAPVLRSGDVVIGHGEIPYTTRPVRTSDTISAQDPDAMRGLTFAGFNVITLAQGTQTRMASTIQVEVTHFDFRFHIQIGISTDNRTESFFCLLSCR